MARCPLETGTDVSTVFWSWPPLADEGLRDLARDKLSMIVEITSWTPTVAFRKPAIAAQSAPATRRRATIARKMCSPDGHVRPSEDADPDGDERADDVLAVAADVEQAALEGERDARSPPGSATWSGSASAGG